MAPMSELEATTPFASFRETEIVLDQGGTFSIALADKRLRANVSFIIDIYDLDNPVHPEGHVGWWRYELEHCVQQLASGMLCRDSAGKIRPAIEKATLLEEWCNQTQIDAKRMEALVVLRSTITNAILSVDRVPVVSSKNDLESFRSCFDRNYQSPRYTPPHSVLPAGRRIHIVSRNIFQRDAVGDLCLDLYRMLRQHQISVHLFADNFDLPLNDIIGRRETVPSRVGRDDIIIYFFSTYDRHLASLASLACHRKIAYFHGITSPRLLQVFDPELSAECAKAIEQIPLLLQFNRLAANSRTTANVMNKIFALQNGRPAPEINVIHPKLIGEGEPCPTSLTKLEQSSPNFLYVGRIRSHKRIEDLLRLLSDYRKIDPSARCTIVGRVDNSAYRDYLGWLQTTQLNLPENAVSWLGSISEDDLALAYQQATVYVSMSEDEGFCIPLLEAMRRNVMVFAYDRPAVRETLGGTGVIFSEKSFEHLSSHLHGLLASQETRHKILETQHRRARELTGKMDGRSFLEILTIES
jgi:glycosyltransferase involved in cell wall biosynthesis